MGPEDSWVAKWQRIGEFYTEHSRNVDTPVIIIIGRYVLLFIAHFLSLPLRWLVNN